MNNKSDINKVQVIILTYFMYIFITVCAVFN